MKVYAVVGFALALSGCSPWLAQDSAKVANEDTIECRYEVPVGSVMRKRVCRKVSETAQESARGRATIDYEEQRRQSSSMINTQRGL